MKLRLLLILTLGLNFSYAQRTNSPDELFGFRLGQYKTVVTNELGQPSGTEVTDDSTVVDFYYISKDSSTYVAFQYIPAKPKEINAIQLSGDNTERPFYGINLKDSDMKLISVFGKPDTLIAQEFNDKKAETWRYSKLNLSILFVGKKIESIRIWDDYEQKDYEHPTIEELLEIIRTKDKSKIADILSPGLEVYYCDKVITWKNSFHKDIYLEEASVVDFITNDEYGLITLSRKKDLVHDVNLRFVMGTGTFPVYKFPKEELISEVVLNYQQGHYKIWEVRYRCEN
jgi:hypothetical protein